jgi:serine/arginine repetitive matrix protein 2
MYGSSPTKQTFELDVGNDLSPQKIRVTVEAENNKENSYPEFSDLRSPSPSPYYASSRRPNTRTTTTTVPLKGLSDSEEDSPAAPPKRGRGRPRKSIGTPVPAKTRNVTPGKSPRRRRTLGSLVDGDDEEDWDFAIGKSVEVGRGKGRSRSRSVKSVTRKTSAAKSTGPSSDLPDSSVANKRGRRQSLLPQEIPILEDLTGRSSPADESFEEVHPDDNMPLRPMEQNTVGSHSEHSTIRSTSTAFGEDVTVAQFDLERTPEAEGWSSPRVVSAIPRHLQATASSRRGSPLVHQAVEEVPRSSLSANGIRSGDDGSRHEEDNYDDEAEDGLGDLEEFDTILESEGFSMISVDSVPSLREHFSSPSIQSKPVESVSSEEREADYERSDNRPSSSRMSSLAEASSSKRRSFDNIQTTQQSLVDVSASSDSTRVQPMATSSPHDQDHEVDASEHFQAGSSVAESALLSQLVEATTASVSDAEHPTTPWLPTPQETPSPDNDSAGSSAQEPSQEKAASESVHIEPTADSSVNMTQMRSSPPSFAAPRYTYTAHLRQRKSLGLTETPSIVFSSPSLPPPKQRPAPREQLPSTTDINGAPKPLLSSSVIAGRALQEIVVPNSASTHSSFLRSPFKSPNARRHPLSPTEEPTKEPVAQPSKLDSSVPGLGPMSWRNLSRSRTLSGAASDEVRKPGFMKNIPLIVDDPFLAEASEQLRSPSPEEKDDYSLGLPTPGQARNPQIVNLVTQETNTVRYSDEMSWQSEYPAMRTPPRDDNEASGSNKAIGGSSRTADRLMESQKQKQRDAWPEVETTQHLGLDLTQVYVVPSDLPTINSTPLITQPQPAPKANVVEDVFDDEDIWLAEARSNSSPSISKHVDIAPKQAASALERPRRSKLPSPWRQNSRRLVYSDELAAQDSSPVHKNEPPTAPPVEARSAALPAPPAFAPRATLVPKDDMKATSVLARMTQSQLAPKAVLLSKSTSKPSDLASGAPQLGALRRSIELPKPQSRPFMAPVERPQAPPVTEDYDQTELSTWDIPQKQNFKPRITPRQSNILGISALLASSPVKKPEPSYVEDETIALPIPAAEKYNDTTEEADFTQTDDSQFVSDEEDQTREEEYTQDLPTSERSHTRSPSALSDLSQLSRTSSLDESTRLSTTPARPAYRRPSAPSPLKSCLRLASTASPIKAVVFSATTAASPSVIKPRFMEDAEWAKSHWLTLRSIYWDYKKNPTPENEIPMSVRESEYAGKTVWGREADGSDSLVMEVWMVDVVHMFLDEAEEEGCLWDEAFVCKRLYGLVGMERKREKEAERKKMEVEQKRVEEEAEKKKGILGLGMGWL